MASTTLVLGGARSGKSRFAVDRQPAHARVAFVATARPGDADLAERIERHRAERPRHWTTLEEPHDLVPRVRRACDGADAVVVDCLSMWVANLMLRGESDEAVLKAADELVALFPASRADLTLVSNEVGLGVHPSSEDGRHYRDLLGFVNQRVAAAADRVVLMVAGLPLTVKDGRA